MSNAITNNKKRALEALQAGRAAQARGENDRAIYYFAHSLEWHPLAEAHQSLGWSYGLEGKYERAIACCRQAIALDPDLGNPYNDIGAYLIEMDREPEAIPFLEKALRAKRYDSRWFPYYNLGRIWERRGKFDQARQCFELALEERPGFEPAATALDRVKGKQNAL
jgi:tetratricopeptide (TPR) repeat protein